MSTDIAGPVRYRATGKRKNAVARVILIPGTGMITCNGRPVDEFFGSKVLVTQARKPVRGHRHRGPLRRRRRCCTAAASPARPARCATASPRP